MGMTEYCAYIGPSIRGVIQNGTLYTGTRADVLDTLKDEIARYPRIALFIVSGSTLPQAKQDIKQPGTYLHHESVRFTAELKKKGGKPYA